MLLESLGGFMNNLLKNKYFQIGLTIFSVVVSSILFFFLIYRWSAFVGILSSIISIFMPIIFGLVIAYILNPAIKGLESKVFNKILKKMDLKEEKIHSLSRGLSILTASIIFLLILYIIISYIIPEILASIQILIGNIPTYIKNIQEWLTNTLRNNPDASKESSYNVTVLDNALFLSMGGKLLKIK